MQRKIFELTPFSRQGQTRVFVEVEADASALKLIYEIRPGGGPAVYWPDLALDPTFRDGLWESTCLEVFLAQAACPKYFEWNLAPSGDWACYEFSDYRKGQTPIRTLKPELRLANHGEFKTLVTKIPWPKQSTELDIQITAILDHGESLSYWSLKHPKIRPDFHWRPGFLRVNTTLFGHSSSLSRS